MEYQKELGKQKYGQKQQALPLLEFSKLYVKVEEKNYNTEVAGNVCRGNILKNFKWKRIKGQEGR